MPVMLLDSVYQDDAAIAEDYRSFDCIFLSHSAGPPDLATGSGLPYKAGFRHSPYAR